MIFLGDIPPPLHGMSAINKQVLDETRKHKTVTFINTSPTWLSRYYHTRLWLLIKATYFVPVTLRFIWAIIVKREKVLYRSLNGGNGQVFDIAWLSIAKVFGLRVFIHHHAALYLTSPSKLFRRICKATNPGTTHIVLGEAMFDALLKNYNINQNNIRVLSNAAFFDTNRTELSNQKESSKIRIGYLANLSFSKGIDVFLTTISNLKKMDFEFEAIVAGPCHDADLKAQLDAACYQLPELKYVGGLYGVEKDKFFSELDYFIYPSRNEAEPLVLYEAAIEGVYILSSEAGCMKSSTARLQGWSMHLDEKDSWAKAATNKILESSSVLKAEGRANRVKIFNLFAAEARKNLDEIIKEIAYAKA